MDTVQILNLILLVVIALIAVLAVLALAIILKIKNKKDEAKEEAKPIPEAKENPNLITRSGKTINSIYSFMEFDKITDSMIVRKNSKQFVMIIECKGVNYDLLSQEEKEAVELGFTELLNTLRFPIQLYVQTRTLNLSNIIAEYNKKTDDVRDQINRLSAQIQMANNRGENELVEKLQFDRERKRNILEYGESIENYTMRISNNKNILQQKTYIVVSYYPGEFEDMSKYSKDELVDIAFSELYTRCQTIIRALISTEVTGKVLDSEALTELLYVAYNRDQNETYTLQDALNAEYDRLYSTAKDIIEEKKKRIEQKVEQDAAKVAARSIIKADTITREERARRVKAKAKEMIEGYRDELSTPLFQEAKRQVDQANVEEIINSNPQRHTIRRKTGN